MLLQLVDLVLEHLGRVAYTADNTKTTSVGHSGGELGAGGHVHAGQQHGVVDAEEVRRRRADLLGRGRHGVGIVFSESLCLVGNKDKRCVWLKVKFSEGGLKKDVVKKGRPNTGPRPVLHVPTKRRYPPPATGDSFAPSLSPPFWSEAGPRNHERAEVRARPKRTSTAPFCSGTSATSGDGNLRILKSGGGVGVEGKCGAREVCRGTNGGTGFAGRGTLWGRSGHSKWCSASRQPFAEGRCTWFRCRRHRTPEKEPFFRFLLK